MDELALINDWIDRINESKALIIVEGINDRIALKNIGIKNDILILNKPIFSVVEDAAKQSDDVIILTDFDTTGKKLFGTLNSGLQRLGVS